MSFQLWSAPPMLRTEGKVRQKKTGNTRSVSNLNLVCKCDMYLDVVWAHAAPACRLLACAGVLFSQRCQARGTPASLPSCTTLTNTSRTWNWSNTDKTTRSKDVKCFYKIEMQKLKKKKKWAEIFFYFFFHLIVARRCWSSCRSSQI